MRLRAFAFPPADENAGAGQAAPAFPAVFLPYYCTVTFTPVLLLSPAVSVTVTVMAVVKLTSTFPDEEVDVA